MRVALCQINTVAGDPAGNADRIRAAYEQAVGGGADLVVVPELAVAGYPPRDLLDHPEFLAACETSASGIAAMTGKAGLVFGTVTRNGGEGKPLFNAALVAHEGRVIQEVRKRLLPTYDVFDEGRHFEPDPSPAQPVSFGGIRWGIHICEDAWNERGFWPRRLYPRDPVDELAQAGSEVLLNLSASPFHVAKRNFRHAMFASHCARHRLPLLYSNLVGGNDELIFDGDAVVLDAEGNLIASVEPFTEEILWVDAQRGDDRVVLVPHHSCLLGGSEVRPASYTAPLAEIPSVRAALVHGLRDYAGKCGFRSAVLGLSGGIDSAVVAALAAEALGGENVWGISLPSRYSSQGSLDDARDLARNLGMPYRVISIESGFRTMLDTLKESFEGTDEGLAEENIQARLRGVILMALSNKFGHLLLSTGNKSEFAVGYSTLYGDMAGGLAVISDVFKTMVYRLARDFNGNGELIPESTLTKPPSAELRPDQTDQDSLPPYDVLDRVLAAYVEGGQPIDTIVNSGVEPETVQHIVSLVTRAEYKRRQAPPGLRITPKAFGMGRRMPIATSWHRAPGRR